MAPSRIHPSCIHPAFPISSSPPPPDPATHATAPLRRPSSAPARRELQNRSTVEANSGLSTGGVNWPAPRPNAWPAKNTRSSGNLRTSDVLKIKQQRYKSPYEPQAAGKHPKDREEQDDVVGKSSCACEPELLQALEQDLFEEFRSGLQTLEEQVKKVFRAELGEHVQGLRQDMARVSSEIRADLRRVTAGFDAQDIIAAVQSSQASIIADAVREERPGDNGQVLEEIRMGSRSVLAALDEIKTEGIKAFVEGFVDVDLSDIQNAVVDSKESLTELLSKLNIEQNFTSLLHASQELQKPAASTDQRDAFSLVLEALHSHKTDCWTVLQEIKNAKDDENHDGGAEGRAKLEVVIKTGHAVIKELIQESNVDLFNSLQNTAKGHTGYPNDIVEAVASMKTELHEIARNLEPIMKATHEVRPSVTAWTIDEEAKFYSDGQRKWFDCAVKGFNADGICVKIKGYLLFYTIPKEMLATHLRKAEAESELQKVKLEVLQAFGVLHAELAGMPGRIDFSSVLDAIRKSNASAATDAECITRTCSGFEDDNVAPSVDLSEVLAALENISKTQEEFVKAPARVDFSSVLDAIQNVKHSSLNEIRDSAHNFDLSPVHEALETFGRLLLSIKQRQEEIIIAPARDSPTVVDATHDSNEPSQSKEMHQAKAFRALEGDESAKVDISRVLAGLDGISKKQEEFANVGFSSVLDGIRDLKTSVEELLNAPRNDLKTDVETNLLSRVLDAMQDLKASQAKEVHGAKAFAALEGEDSPKVDLSPVFVALEDISKMLAVVINAPARVDFSAVLDAIDNLKTSAAELMNAPARVDFTSVLDAIHDLKTSRAKESRQAEAFGALGRDESPSPEVDLSLVLAAVEGISKTQADVVNALAGVDFSPVLDAIHDLKTGQVNVDLSPALAALEVIRTTQGELVNAPARVDFTSVLDAIQSIKVSSLNEIGDFAHKLDLSPIHEALENFGKLLLSMKKMQEEISNAPARDSSVQKVNCAAAASEVVEKIDFSPVLEALADFKFSSIVHEVTDDVLQRYQGVVVAKLDGLDEIVKGSVSCLEEELMASLNGLDENCRDVKRRVINLEEHMMATDSLQRLPETHTSVAKPMRDSAVPKLCGVEARQQTSAPTSVRSEKRVSKALADLKWQNEENAESEASKVSGFLYAGEEVVDSGADKSSLNSAKEDALESLFNESSATRVQPFGQLHSCNLAEGAASRGLPNVGLTPEALAEDDTTTRPFMTEAGKRIAERFADDVSLEKSSEGERSPRKDDNHSPVITPRPSLAERLSMELGLNDEGTDFNRGAEHELRAGKVCGESSPCAQSDSRSSGAGSPCKAWGRTSDGRGRSPRQAAGIDAPTFGRHF